MLRPFAWNHNNVGTCWHLLRIVCNRSNFWRTKSQTFLLFCDRRSVAQQCCARLHGTTTMLALVKTYAYAHCNLTKNRGKDYCTRMHRFFRRPPIMLAVVAFVCMHLATSANNSQHRWANNVVTCCVRLYGPLGPTMLRVVGQQCCVRLHVPLILFLNYS